MKDDSVPRDSTDADSGFILWVYPFDEENVPVDPVFLEAAQKIGQHFLFYRARELQDESLAREFAEKAVQKTSLAHRTNPVRKPVAYIFQAFRHLVDAHLRRLGRLVPLDGRALSKRLDRRTEIGIEERLTWNEAFDSLEEYERAALVGVRVGLRVSDMAQDFGIRPNTLSKRISRARKKARDKMEAKNRLDGNSTKAAISGPDERKSVGRAEHGGDFPVHGGERAA